ncbi:MAG TPA: hypothetical protein VF765_15360, partial [Polyangiaceae bacterium]
VAGSTTAGVVIDQSSGAHHRRHAARSTAHRHEALTPARPAPAPILRASAASSAHAVAKASVGRTMSAHPRARSGVRHEPGGFSYLGVPSAGSRRTVAGAARVAGVEPTSAAGSAGSHAGGTTSTGGGEFSP